MQAAVLREAAAGSAAEELSGSRSRDLPAAGQGILRAAKVAGSSNCFSDARDFGLKSGDIIDITLSEDPAEALYVTATFDNVYLPRGPVTIAIIRRHRATPCRVSIEEAA
jgi:hypothetical protein